MASRTGARVGGTDGSDYSHREKVAPQYQRIVEIKRKLKPVILLQTICLISLLINLVLVYHTTTASLTAAGFLIGLPCIYFGLKKNSIALVNFYSTCCVVFGLFPMSFRMYKLLFGPSMLAYPGGLILTVETGLILLLNVIGAYLARALMSLWMRSGG